MGYLCWLEIAIGSVIETETVKEARLAISGG